MRGDRKLLLANKAWAAGKQNLNKNYFKQTDRGQDPEFLWIGPSDSRVPAEEITGVEPGEILVHRNIANLVNHNDLNMLAILKYAVELYQVKHIIVCGHYGCGGVQAAYSSQDYGLLNKWLYPIKDIQKNYRDEIDAQPDDEAKLARLSELNVIEQVKQLSHTSIIQRSWVQKNLPHLHGWIYNPNDGHLHNLICLNPNSEIDPIYKYDIDKKEDE